MNGTFISYRENDAKPWALLLRDELVEVFGEQHVFLDKDALHAGSWPEQLRQALDRSGVVLVVMGPRWLDARSGDGTRRLDDPDDVHRQEIASALAREDVTVIPVLVDGARMPGREELPADIVALTDQQARSLADRSAHRELDLKALVSDIQRATGVVASPRVARAPKRFSGPLWVAGLGLSFISIYIGMEIDYRHWSWFVFLLLVPAGVAIVLVRRVLER